MIRRLLLLATLLLPALPRSAEAIPAFARKYGVSCQMCHAPVPRLNAFGEHFAANGFQMAPGEPPRDTIATGDPLLRLPRTLPLAVRFDAYLSALSRRRPGEAIADQQAPWTVKVLSGGPIAEKISYYAYFLASERGEVAGLEDAYVQFSDIAGTGVSVIAGQFQVSDPLFKRELRLEYEDYQPYRVRVGDTRADLTYDRGLMALWSPREGTDVAFEVVNGEGLSAASERRQYDSDGFKNMALRLSQELGPVRIGGFGYYGEDQTESTTNRVRILGPDATVALGANTELNLQFLRRWDDDPFLLGPAGPESVVDAAMAELIFTPGGAAGRWAFTGLFNWIEADAPVVSLRIGEQEDEPGFLQRYRTASVGATYTLRRNFRLLGETRWDFDLDQARFVTGFVTAF